jgi:DNA-binding response OmpR family regulator
MTNPGRACTRKQLCHQALGSGGTVQERTIDAHIRTIRRKLGPAGDQIVTVWGIGYRLLPENQTEADESTP